MRTISRPVAALTIRIACGATMCGRNRSSRPRPASTRVAFGESWMPAPASSTRAACSRITVRNPTRVSASAAVKPPIPAPAITMVRERATRRVPLKMRSGGGRHPGAFRRDRLVGVELRIEAIERGAIRADELVVVAHVAEHMRMIEGRRRADAHEFLRADVDHRHARIVMEMRNDVLGHDVLLSGP